MGHGHWLDGLATVRRLRFNLGARQCHQARIVAERVGRKVDCPDERNGELCLCVERANDEQLKPEFPNSSIARVELDSSVRENASSMDHKSEVRCVCGAVDSPYCADSADARMVKAS